MKFNVQVDLPHVYWSGCGSFKMQDSTLSKCYSTEYIIKVLQYIIKVLRMLIARSTFRGP